jgi:DNA-binding transcriptional LysR family regulator
MPSLNGLRAFQVTARHHETRRRRAVRDAQRAQPITKGLESELGTPLFRRDNRAIALTEAAQALLPPVRNSFRLIADASDGARGDPHGGSLTIGVTAFCRKLAGTAARRFPRTPSRHRPSDHRCNDARQSVDERSRYRHPARPRFLPRHGERSAYGAACRSGGGSSLAGAPWPSRQRRGAARLAQDPRCGSRWLGLVVCKPGRGRSGFGARPLL